MYHDPDAVTLARLEAEALRDERALVAEGQRLVLHRGRELVAMSATVAGPTGAREAERFVDVVLWGPRAPDGWPIGTMIETFRTAADLSPSARALSTQSCFAPCSGSRGAPTTSTPFGRASVNAGPRVDAVRTDPVACGRP